MTIFNQSECVISVKLNYAALNFVYDIGPRAFHLETKKKFQFQISCFARNRQLRWQVFRHRNEDLPSLDQSLISNYCSTIPNHFLNFGAFPVHFSSKAFVVICNNCNQIPSMSNHVIQTFALTKLLFTSFLFICYEIYLLSFQPFYGVSKR